MARKNNVYQAYLEAKAEYWQREGIRLTPKQFLDTIDPTAEHDENVSEKFLRDLSRGSTAADSFFERINSTDGEIYNIALADKTGKIVDSANIELPEGVTLLDALESGWLQSAVDKYLESRYRELNNIPEEDEFDEDSDFFDEDEGEILNPTGIESNARKSSQGLVIAGVRPLRTTKKLVQIVRRK